MSKWIKARRCYVCGELFDVERGGLIFAKKYSNTILGEHHETSFCRDCSYNMMEYAKRKKVEVENESMC